MRTPIEIIQSWIKDAADGHVQNAGVPLTPIETQLLISTLQAVGGDIAAESDTAIAAQRDREQAILEARIEEAKRWMHNFWGPYNSNASGYLSHVSECRDCQMLADLEADLARLGDAPVSQATDEK